MAAATWASWSGEWELNSKVSFDGISQIIYVHSEVTDFDIRTDLYSAWIDWISLYDNIKFKSALRTTGFDPIGGGAYTGDVYFLINGWKLSINTQRVRVTGVLYSDDYDTPFFTENMTAQYPVTVSSLVTTISTGGAGASAAEVRQELDANSTRLSSIQTTVNALPNDLTAAMDNNSVKLGQIKAILLSMDIPTASETATAVWNTPVSAVSDKTTVGGFVTRVLLSIPKFLGLK